jgi:uncharacterized damage-inducible protein DinB
MTMEHIAPAVSALELNAWIGWQLAKWDAWQAGIDSDWLRLPSGNPAWPELAGLFDHAVTPLHRYSDRILGAEPVAPAKMNAAEWPQLYAWAGVCLARHASACHAAAGDAEQLVEFQTRSAGVMVASARLALAHAATHCAWHLAGITHLLRSAGLEPPQRCDMIFWAMEQASASSTAGV